MMLGPTRSCRISTEVAPPPPRATRAPVEDNRVLRFTDKADIMPTPDEQPNVAYAPTTPKSDEALRVSERGQTGAPRAAAPAGSNGTARRVSLTGARRVSLTAPVDFNFNRRRSSCHMLRPSAAWGEAKGGDSFKRRGSVSGTRVMDEMFGRGHVKQVKTDELEMAQGGVLRQDKKLHEGSYLTELLSTEQRRAVVLPNSRVKNAWDALIAILVLYTTVMLPIQLCFDGVSTHRTPSHPQPTSPNHHIHLASPLASPRLTSHAIARAIRVRRRAGSQHAADRLDRLRCVHGRDLHL